MSYTLRSVQYSLATHSLEKADTDILSGMAGLYARSSVKRFTYRNTQGLVLRGHQESLTSIFVSAFDAVLFPPLRTAPDPAASASPADPAAEPAGPGHVDHRNEHILLGRLQRHRDHGSGDDDYDDYDDDDDDSAERCQEQEREEAVQPEEDRPGRGPRIDALLPEHAGGGGPSSGSPGAGGGLRGASVLRQLNHTSPYPLLGNENNLRNRFVSEETSIV